MKYVIRTALLAMMILLTTFALCQAEEPSPSPSPLPAPEFAIDYVNENLNITNLNGYVLMTEKRKAIDTSTGTVPLANYMGTTLYFRRSGYFDVNVPIKERQASPLSVFDCLLDQITGLVPNVHEYSKDLKAAPALWTTATENFLDYSNINGRETIYIRTKAVTVGDPQFASFPLRIDVPDRPKPPTTLKYDYSSSTFVQLRSNLEYSRYTEADGALKWEMVPGAVFDPLSEIPVDANSALFVFRVAATYHARRSVMSAPIPAYRKGAAPTIGPDGIKFDYVTEEFYDIPEGLEICMDDAKSRYTSMKLDKNKRYKFRYIPAYGNQPLNLYIRFSAVVSNGSDGLASSVPSEDVLFVMMPRAETPLLANALHPTLGVIKGDWDNESIVLKSTDLPNDSYELYDKKTKTWYPIEPEASGGGANPDPDPDPDPDPSPSPSPQVSDMFNLSKLMTRSTYSITVRRAAIPDVRTASAPLRVSLRRPSAPKRSDISYDFTTGDFGIINPNPNMLVAEVVNGKQGDYQLFTSPIPIELSQTKTNDYFLFKYINKEENGIVVLSSAPLKVKKPRITKKTFYSFDRLSEQYSALVNDRHEFRIDDDPDWTVITQQVRDSKILLPNNVKDFSIRFRIKGNERTAPSIPSPALLLKKRADAPTYNTSSGVYIDYTTETLNGVNGMAYRKVMPDGAKPKKWKLVRATAKTLALERLFPKNGTEPVKYEIIRVFTANNSNSDPLEIVLNPRPLAPTEDDVSVNYDTNEVQARNKDLLYSYDRKTWTRLDRGATVKNTSSKQMFFKTAPIISANPNDSVPASASALRVKF